MTEYFRPIVRSAGPRSTTARQLAGGWCWFDTLEVIERGEPSRLCAAADAPDDILEKLTESRSPIAGLDISAPQVMGILNVTPDSFSDGGDHSDRQSAVSRAHQMKAEGAAILDIGGESTRPGADLVAVDEELARVLPVVEDLQRSDVGPLSIDSRKSGVIAAIPPSPNVLVNDVSAMSFDPQMADVVAEREYPICLMHASGDPATMQNDPKYDDVLLDVYDYLEGRIGVAEAAGIPRSRIVVDPGIGFGKTVAHNLALIRGISLFHALGCPVLLGASRKRFIGTLGNAPDAKDRLGGSVAVALEGVKQGVQILRVHDTFATRQAIELQMALIGTNGK